MLSWEAPTREHRHSRRLSGEIDHDNLLLSWRCWSGGAASFAGDGDVVRRINTTPAELAHRIVSVGDPPPRLALGPLGELRVDSHPRQDPSDSAPVWQMRSRLVGAGPRIALFSRVDIEISPASSRSIELRVLPRSRHIHRWAARRRRRYFQLAHAAADRLAHLFVA